MPQLKGVSAALAGDPEALLAAEEIAVSLGLNPVRVTGDRALYHAASVIAGNFSTVLMATATSLLEASGLPPEQARGFLAPLAISSTKNSAAIGASSLTGPISRGDVGSIASHRRAISKELPELLPLYDELCAAAVSMAVSDGLDPKTALRLIRP